jgi:hypothetical protein
VGGNIFALPTPKYVDMSMRLEVKMTGCPTGYLAYLLTLGYKLSIKRYIIEYKL